MSDSRKNILGVRPALIVALLAMIGVYAVVTYRQRSGTGRAPEAVVLQPLPSPDISRFEPLIRQQIANAQARVENAPLDPRANVGLGMVYQAQSLLLAAGVCYRRGIALLPDDFEAHYFLALASEQAGDLDAALEVCSRATELDPSYQPARLLLGRLRWAKNEPDQAEVIFTDIARADPRSSAAYFWLGRICAKRGQLDAAVENFDQALALGPGNADLHYALAMALRDSGQAERAAEHLRHYQDGRRTPLYADPYLDKLRRLRTGADYEFQLALKLAEEGHFEESLQHYRQALRIDPNLAEAHQNLGVALLRLGLVDEAVEHLRQAVEISPNIPQAHTNLGNALARMGRKEEAHDSYTQAIGLDPENPAVHNDFANFLLSVGDLETAIKHYRQAV
ncbi:MAG: tetratricopeptide repeat protein, partial [Planctomycetota bacterium]